MSATCTVHEQCPECGIDVPITLEVDGTTSAGGTLVITLEPDVTDLVAHAWTHEHQ